jgi:ubiquinone/menaquinone biosynthesis C-methylase UbiE/uncharacterized protein YbaR (Trm112 family)
MKIIERREAEAHQSGIENWCYDVIACPQCKGNLVPDGEILICDNCHLDFVIEDGIPALLPPPVRVALNQGRAPVKHYYFAEEHYDWTRDPKALELAYHRYRKWQTWKKIFKILKPGKIVLDLGCGTGLITSQFIKQKQKVIALDMNRWALARMDGKPTVVKVQGDGEALPIQDNSIDIVVMTEMIEHLEQPEAAAKEVFRVCKPGAKVVGTVPSNSRIWKWRKYLSLTCGGGEPFHHNFNRNEITDLWKRAGFKVNTHLSCMGLNWMWILEK